VDHAPAARGDALDVAHLEAQTAGDAELAAELLALFESQCGRLLPAIRGGGDPRAVSDAAHTLRGGAAAVGAWGIGQACLEVETHLTDARAPVPAELLDRLERRHAAFERALAAWRQAP
jgi:HPt (histidine-containing phosphotransfer) domain-containing protein